MKTLAHVVGGEAVDRSIDLRAVEGERDRSAVGEEGGVGVFFNCIGIHGYAARIFGVEQCVEVSARYVRLGVDAAKPQLWVRPDFGTEEGHVVVVCVEDIAHHSAAQADCVDDIGGVDVGEFHFVRTCLRGDFAVFFLNNPFFYIR